MDAICTARRVLDAEINGLRELSEHLDGDISKALDLLNRDGKVIATGMGKSGLVARKIAATLSSTGTSSSFLYAGDASHGDLGLIGKQDSVLMLSKSGQSEELMIVADYAQNLNIPIIAITENRYSQIGSRADCALIIPKSMEACPLGVAPTTSTTVMMALGDALAVALMEMRDFTREDFYIRHPGGTLGVVLGQEN